MFLGSRTHFGLRLFDRPSHVCAGLSRAPGKARDWRQQWAARGGNAMQQQQLQQRSQQSVPSFGMPSLNGDAFAQPQAPAQVRLGNHGPPCLLPKR